MLFLHMLVKIKENSWQARLAAKYLKTDNVALVLGRTIHLWGVDRDYFLSDVAWVKHELVHIAQFKKYGWVRMTGFYLLETIRKGYYKNKFEIEAREGENKKIDLTNVEFI